MSGHDNWKLAAPDQDAPQLDAECEQCGREDYQGNLVDDLCHGCLDESPEAFTERSLNLLAELTKAEPPISKHYKAVFHIDGAWDVDYRLDVEAENHTEAIKLVRKLAPGAFNIELRPGYNCKKCRDTGWACCLCLVCGLAYLGFQKAPHPDVRCECQSRTNPREQA